MKKKELIEKNVILVTLQDIDTKNITFKKRKLRKVMKTDKNYSYEHQLRTYYCRTDEDYFIGGDYLFIANLEKKKEAYEKFKEYIIRVFNDKITIHKRDIEELQEIVEKLSDSISSLKQNDFEAFLKSTK